MYNAVLNELETNSAEARRSGRSTSGSLRAGPVHSDPCVGLGPVNGAPPGGLAEAPWRRRQLGEGGPRRA